MNHILCLDDNENFILGLRMQLRAHYRVFTATNFAMAEDILKRGQIDLVLLDASLSQKGDGINLIKTIKKSHPSVAIIMLSGFRDPTLIVEAIKQGASDYICKPCPLDELVAVIDKNLRQRHVWEKNAALVEMYNHDQSAQVELIGDAPAMRTLRQQAQKVRGRNATILIEGESGTGKEVIAKHIHALEGQLERPFIAINCAAIPESLLESELFGHEKGAFTGAVKRKLGKFELASEGDIFLDEINSLKLDMQAKLLRVLQDKSFYRVGGVDPVKVNARVIVASNTSLDKEVESGRFRDDLLYRLRIVTFAAPALRERMEDLSLLMAHFVKKHFGERRVVFSNDVLEILSGYQWPGNVRELENLIQTLCIMASGDKVTVDDLPAWLLKNYQAQDPSQKWIRRAVDLSITGAAVDDFTLKDHTRLFEIEFIKSAVAKENGDVLAAAKKLGISKSKVYWTLAQDPRKGNHEFNT